METGGIATTRQNSELVLRLKRAVGNGDVTAVKRLIKGGMDINSPTFWVNISEVLFLSRIQRERLPYRRDIGLALLQFICSVLLGLSAHYMVLCQ